MVQESLLGVVPAHGFQWDSGAVEQTFGGAGTIVRLMFDTWCSNYPGQLDEQDANRLGHSSTFLVVVSTRSGSEPGRKASSRSCLGTD